MKRFLVSVLAGLFAGGVAMADDSAVIKTVARNSWKLQNEVVSLALEFKGGKLTVGSMKNLEAGVDYLAGSPAVPLFTHIINGAAVTADDGGWTLADAAISDIELYGKKWGRRLEVTLSRNTPVLFQVRQIFEVYNGRAGLRLYSYLKNPGKNEVTISESSVAAFGFPDKPHHLNYIEGKLKWVESTGSLTNGGRNCIGRYDTGDGWVVVPENNWATCLAGGKKQGDQRHKLMSIQAFVDKDVVRVVTNPESIQLVLMPGEDVEYFSVNLGVFKGTAMDGRMAVSEHLRMRFKFHDPSRFLSTNDWQWHGWRTDANYRNIVIPAARDAGFDRIHIDDFWYAPEDSTDPKGNWTDMPALCDLIIKNGMKPGHWFSLQGK